MELAEKMDKLGEISEKFLQCTIETLDYNTITNNILELTNARYVFLSLFDQDSQTYKIVSESGKKNQASKLSEVITEKIIVKKETLGRLSIFTNLGEELLGQELLKIYIQCLGLILDKLNTEKSLKNLEEKFMNYRDTAPFSMIVIDFLNWKIIDLNETARQMTGYSQEELLAISPEDLFTRESQIFLADHLKNSISSGKDQVELGLIKKSKEVIEIELKSVRLTDTICRCFLKDITEEKMASEELKHINFMKNTLLDNTNQIFLLLDKNYRIIDYNKMAERLARDFFQVELYIGTLVTLFVPESNKGFFYDKFQGAFKGEADKNEIPIKDSQDRDLFFELSLNPVVNEETDEIWAVSLTGYNVTEFRNIERALRRSEERFKMAAMSTNDLIYELDLKTDKVTWFGDSQKFVSWGLSFNPKSFKEWIGFVHPEDQERLARYSERDLPGRKPYSGEYRLLAKNGRIIFVEDYSLGIYDENNNLTRIVGAVTDISDRKYYEEELKYLSFYDQLTEVNNRGYFEEKLKDLDGKINPISIIAIDLDGLKLINDTMGHYSGDAQLWKTAKIIKESVKKGDIVARTGGDEFGVILLGSGEKEAEKTMEIINQKVKAYNETEQEIPISISCGTATLTESFSLEEVFRMADDYMYRNKLSKGNSAKSQIISSLMATLAERDYITEGHANRLSDICIKIGMSMNLSNQKINNLNLLAKVHDLGKVGIPDRILQKPSALNAEEWEIMKLHPEKGFRIAISAPDLAGIADLILKHHERWDGTGYPIALKGKDIPIECRILSVADTFDAMTNDRPYSKACSKEEAIAEIIRCSGSQFDPEVVKVFLEII